MQIVTTLCDMCYRNGQKVESERMHTIGHDKVVMDVDLCARHAQELAEMLGPYFAEGRRSGTVAISAPEKRERKPLARGQFACGLGDCPAIFPTNQGAAMHRWRAHDYRKTEADKQAAHERKKEQDRQRKQREKIPA